MSKKQRADRQIDDGTGRDMWEHRVINITRNNSDLAVISGSIDLLK